MTMQEIINTLLAIWWWPLVIGATAGTVLIIACLACWAQDILDEKDHA